MLTDEMSKFSIGIKEKYMCVLQTFTQYNKRDIYLCGIYSTQFY